MRSRSRGWARRWRASSTTPDTCVSPADLFHLDDLRDELVELERWGEKKVDNLLAEIEAARAIPFERFLTALSIPDVASATARALARHFASLEELRDADLDELQHVDGIGPEVAGNLRAWFDASESAAPARAPGRGRRGRWSTPTCPTARGRSARGQDAGLHRDARAA